MASCRNLPNSLRIDALGILVIIVVAIIYYLVHMSFAWDTVFPVWRFCPYASLIYRELKGNLRSLLYYWIAYIHRQCSLFTYFCLSIILFIQACLWLIELMSDAGIYSDQWTRLTQGSTVFLPSNGTKPNMHKTNARLQALAEGSNYLYNNKAAEAISHVAA